MTLADHLRNSQKILIFTGAGISTGSGIPDFRGPNGIWTRRQPVYYHDFLTSEASRIEHWDYKLEGRAAFRDARPNNIHHAIVRLERAGKLRAVVTQNIDGLHSLAGTGTQYLVELHGTNTQVECQQCRWRGDPEPHFEFFRIHRKPPLCHCGGFLKPATISFGQSLDPIELERAQHAAMEADLVVALGSTLSVYPAASFPLIAAQRGVPYVVVNRGATDHDGESSVTLRLEGEAGELFPAAVDAALAPSSGALEAGDIRLVPQNPEHSKALLEGVDAFERRFGLKIAEGVREFFTGPEVSADFLAALNQRTKADPWRDGFAVVHIKENIVIGVCSFTGPPGSDETVEIAYGIAPAYQNRGYAGDAARALMRYAFASGRVRTIVAHTLPEHNASTRVLARCDFRRVGEVNHPEDGPIWRWEKQREDMTP